MKYSSGMAVCYLMLISNIVTNRIAGFKLTVMHTNDVHARFEQFTAAGSRCSQSEAAEGRCYGGVARRATMIKQIREANEHVLLLDGGDQYQGTPWFNLYKGSAPSFFMNLLNYTAMALGNHEFDMGLSGLIPFLENVTFPIVSANIRYPDELSERRRRRSLSQGLTAGTRDLWRSLVHSHVVINITGSERIGIIGYTTRDTSFLSHPAPLVFDDVISSVRAVVEGLKDEGVNKIIAVGHNGFNADMVMAQSIPDIDIIVGGHTDTFLYSGDPSAQEKAEDVYPVVVTHAGMSHPTLVVQDYTFGKYLGFLQVEFNEDGGLVHWTGNPILLDHSVKEDAEVLALVDNWGEGVQAAYSRYVGFTEHFLDGARASCRLRECVLGNLMADGFVDYFYTSPEAPDITGITMSLINGGSVRASIEPGNITFESLVSVLPFGNQINVMDLQGAHLLAALEYSVSGYDVVEQNGKFLQLSGINVTYDLTKPDGQRVVSVLTRSCSETGSCSLDAPFIPLNLSALYRIVVFAFLIDGGDGYSVIQDNAQNIFNLGLIDIDIFSHYIETHSPVLPLIDGRITFESSQVTTTFKAVTSSYHVTGDVTTSYHVAGDVTTSYHVAGDVTTDESHHVSSAELLHHISLHSKLFLLLIINYYFYFL